jgi:sulfoquinovose isomerase
MLAAAGFEGSDLAKNDPSPLSKSTLHRRWLMDQALSLFAFFQPSALNPAGGFHALARDGSPLTSDREGGTVQHLHTTTRMIYSFALARDLGVAGADRVIDHGMDFLWSRHRDSQYGGYFWGVDDRGAPEPVKQAYGHAFVLLAASAAKRASHPDADRLLADITDIIKTKFWEPAVGATTEDYSPDWRALDAYRGQNSNMHLTEALMAAFQATGTTMYLEMAESIAQLIVHKHAQAADWRVPEHFDGQWQVDFNYGGNPMFRPAGTTPGHALEWSRLLVELYILGQRRHGWMVPAAEALFVKACNLGWNETHGGFYYTLDWNNRPLQTACLWWPCAEAIAAAHVLQSVSDNPTFEIWYRRVWKFVITHLIDKSQGGWFPEVDAAHQPVDNIFVGKPDIYHAIQACLIPLKRELTARLYLKDIGS